jgi:hypothetical protein
VTGSDHRSTIYDRVPLPAWVGFSPTFRAGPALGRAPDNGVGTWPAERCR